MRPAAARPPLPSLPEGEIPLCFPLGPKTDPPGGGQFPAFLHPSHSPFLSAPWAQHSPLELGGRARVLLQLFATLETRLIWLWRFESISNRWGLGSSHTPSRALSHTRAGLSLLTAFGQRLATRWSPRQLAAAPTAPHPPHFPPIPCARLRDGRLLPPALHPRGRVLERVLPGCLAKGDWKGGGPAAPPNGDPVDVTRPHTHTYPNPETLGPTFLRHSLENDRRGEGARWSEGVGAF